MRWLHQLGAGLHSASRPQLTPAGCSQGSPSCPPAAAPTTTRPPPRLAEMLVSAFRHEKVIWSPLLSKCPAFVHWQVVQMESWRLEVLEETFTAWYGAQPRRSLILEAAHKVWAGFQTKERHKAEDKGRSRWVYIFISGQWEEKYIEMQRKEVLKLKSFPNNNQEQKSVHNSTS